MHRSLTQRNWRKCKWNNLALAIARQAATFFFLPMHKMKVSPCQLCRIKNTGRNNLSFMHFEQGFRSIVKGNSVIGWRTRFRCFIRSKRYLASISLKTFLSNNFLSTSELSGFFRARYDCKVNSESQIEPSQKNIFVNFEKWDNPYQLWRYIHENSFSFMIIREYLHFEDCIFA